jgi:hypothetical protein
MAEVQVDDELPDDDCPLYIPLSWLSTVMVLIPLSKISVVACPSFYYYTLGKHTVLSFSCLF